MIKSSATHEAPAKFVTCRPMRRAIAVAAIVLTCAHAGFAEVRLPSVIGSSMVVQRDRAVPIWGWADAGEQVTLVLRDSAEAVEQVRTRADRDGNWRVELAPRPAGGPYSLAINERELTGVMYGEVWLCSGQSNMEWPVMAADAAEMEIAAASYPGIRLFHVPRVAAGSPLPDTAAQWQTSSPQTIATFSAVCYYFGRELHAALEVPVGLISAAWGGTRIEPWTPLAGFRSVDGLGGLADSAVAADASYREQLPATLQALEAWLADTRAALQSGGPILPMPESAHPLANEEQPTALYNGMIHPLVPYAIRGAVWYQGEANVGDGMSYRDKMEALIGGWREVWGQGDFPFFYAQLAPYDYTFRSMLVSSLGVDVSPEYWHALASRFGYELDPYRLPEIWEAQTAALSIPNTGMAVTNDIGNVADIHPTNKQEVGRRLSLWALARTYGQSELTHAGPSYRSMELRDGAIVLHFDDAEGLRTRDGEPPTWFEIAASDRHYVEASAVIEGETVVVSSAAVSAPVSVRFAWHTGAEPNLENGAGLPAGAFRTLPAAAGSGSRRERARS